MKLLPEDLRKTLPKIYAQENRNDPFVYAKFFFPAGNWTWFACEGEQEGDNFLFFGYVIGTAQEWGYFSLRELEEVLVKGLTVERDLYFQPDKFSICFKRWRSERGLN